MTALLSLVLGLWLIAAWALDRYGQRPAVPGQRWDAIVVLGARVASSGRPSAALDARVRRAHALFSDNFAASIVVTGGPGDGPISEAESAATLLGELGVPEDAIRIEDQSSSTDENARFAAQVLDGATRVLLVTDTYHVFRSERVFRRYFEAARGVGVHGLPLPRLRGALREVGAVLGYAASRRL